MPGPIPIEQIEAFVTCVNAVWAANGNSIRQIVAYGERDEPDAVGSGVLISIGPHDFLVSARHVLERRRAQRLGLDAPGAFLPLTGALMFSVELTGGAPELDIAASVLPSEFRMQVGDDSFLELRDLELHPEFGRTHNYLAAGFPHRRSRRDWETMRLERLLALIVGFSSQRVYAASRLPEHDHVVIEFQRDQMIKDGIEQTAPKPHGMSGGGLWAIDVSGQTKHCLAGILTQYRDTGVSYMAATRITRVLELLARFSPEVEQEIRKAWQVSAKE